MKKNYYFSRRFFFSYDSYRCLDFNQKPNRILLPSRKFQEEEQQQQRRYIYRENIYKIPYFKQNKNKHKSQKNYSNQ